MGTASLAKEALRTVRANTLPLYSAVYVFNTKRLSKYFSHTWSFSDKTRSVRGKARLQAFDRSMHFGTENSDSSDGSYPLFKPAVKHFFPITGH